MLSRSYFSFVDKMRKSGIPSQDIKTFSHIPFIQHNPFVHRRIKTEISLATTRPNTEHNKRLEDISGRGKNGRNLSRRSESSVEKVGNGADPVSFFWGVFLSTRGISLRPTFGFCFRFLSFFCLMLSPNSVSLTPGSEFILVCSIGCRGIWMS